LRAFSWKPVADGTSQRRVRAPEREYTEVSREFKAVEDLPSQIVTHIGGLGLPDANEFIRANAAIAEQGARTEAARLERETPTAVLAERRF
jgi:hypothetical protein